MAGAPMPGEPTAAKEVWRRLPLHIGSSEWHFALSDALSRHVSTPTLWWHATDYPTLILGTGQDVADVNLESCRERGVRLVRRQAGGTAVLAGPSVLGLDVALPAGYPLITSDILGAYRWLGSIWVDATRALGVDSQLVSVEEARSQEPVATPDVAILRLACFGSLSPYEVVTGRRKLVGLAQVRRRTGVLLQSAVHLHFDAEGLVQLLPAGGDACLARLLEDRAIGLDEVSPHASRRKVIAAFETSLQRILDIHLVTGDWTGAELGHAATYRATVVEDLSDG